MIPFLPAAQRHGVDPPKSLMRTVHVPGKSSALCEAQSLTCQSIRIEW